MSPFFFLIHSTIHMYEIKYIYLYKNNDLIKITLNRILLIFSH